MLAQGKTVVESIHRARRAMKYSDDGKFFDWGIPVLYCSDPDSVIFPRRTDAAWAHEYEQMSKGVSLVSELSKQSGSLGVPISVATPVDAKSRASAKFRVGLVDIDAKAGFLPRLIDEANRCQTYYSFRMVYLPIPAGYVKTFDGE